MKVWDSDLMRLKRQHGPRKCICSHKIGFARGGWSLICKRGIPFIKLNAFWTAGELSSSSPSAKSIESLSRIVTSWATLTLRFESGADLAAIIYINNATIQIILCLGC